MTKATILIRILWMITILSIFFIDRENMIMVLVVISMLLILTCITIIRAFESREEWRKMIKDGDVEIKDKISFD